MQTPDFDPDLERCVVSQQHEWYALVSIAERIGKDELDGEQVVRDIAARHWKGEDSVSRRLKVILFLLQAIPAERIQQLGYPRAYKLYRDETAPPNPEGTAVLSFGKVPLSLKNLILASLERIAKVCDAPTREDQLDFWISLVADASDEQLRRWSGAAKKTDAQGH